ncbi:MAG: protein kinase [Gammaproteobacteria bacterium]
MEAMYNLTRYGRADNLLDIKAVISIVWRSAEGVAYAHQQNVVHHDTIPANIMYDPGSDSVKITDSSKTKTGSEMATDLKAIFSEPN